MLSSQSKTEAGRGSVPQDHRLGYVAAIDGLRTVAVGAVILFHLGLPIHGGFVGVDIFFVISGFVVAASVLNLRFDSLRAFLAFFYARRVLRIMPALLVCLFATFAAWAFFVPPSWLSDANERVGRAAIFGLSNIVLAANSDNYFSPRAEFNPFTHTWSLGVEEQFYLLFPLFWFIWVRTGSSTAARRGALWAVGTASIVTLLLSAYLSYAAPRFAFYMIYSRFWELGLGVVLAATFGGWKTWLRAMPAQSQRVYVLVAVLILGISLFAADEALFPFPWALPPVVATGMIICAVVSWPDTRFARFMASRPMVYVGLRSYSLYLWHWPIFVLLRWTLGLDTSLSMAVALGLTVFMAWASYAFVEQPFRHSSVFRRLPRVAVVGAGIGAMLVAGVAVTGIIRLKPDILLSVTRDTDTWLPEKPLAVADGCPIEITRSAQGSGTLTRFMPRCDGMKAAPTMYVLGDSHAGAYAPLYGALAAAGRYQIALFQKPGCASLRLNAPTAEGEQPCAVFNRGAMQIVAQEAAAGDVIFLPSLRTQRFGDQWGAVGVVQSSSLVLAGRNRQQAVAEATTYLRPIAEKGAAIVLEAPKPVFKVPPFRCSDWFNASNSICLPGFTVSKNELKELAEPAWISIELIRDAVPHAVVWDPFPVLCPGETCSAIAENGKPLFFDGDHLSRYANALLLPSIENALAGLRSRSAGP